MAIPATAATPSEGSRSARDIRESVPDIRLGARGSTLPEAKAAANPSAAAPSPRLITAVAVDEPLISAPCSALTTISPTTKLQANPTATYANSSRTGVLADNSA